MENLTQKEPVWRENGKGFVESVTRLLERLLDYRNVGQVSRYRVIQNCISMIHHHLYLSNRLFREHFKKCEFIFYIFII